MASNIAATLGRHHPEGMNRGRSDRLRVLPQRVYTTTSLTARAAAARQTPAAREHGAPPKWGCESEPLLPAKGSPRPARPPRLPGAKVTERVTARYGLLNQSSSDIPTLQFAEQPDRPSLRLRLHDDPAREFDYVAGPEQALQLASTRGWPVVSIDHDWATVF